MERTGLDAALSTTEPLRPLKDLPSFKNFSNLCGRKWSWRWRRLIVGLRRDSRPELGPTADSCLRQQHTPDSTRIRKKWKQRSEASHLTVEKSHCRDRLSPSWSSPQGENSYHRVRFGGDQQPLHPVAYCFRGRRRRGSPSGRGRDSAPRLCLRQSKVGGASSTQSRHLRGPQQERHR